MRSNSIKVRAGLDSNNCAAKGYRMDERTFLLQTHDASENANEENSTTVTSLNGGRDASLQESEIHELQILLDKAQTLLENQPEENAVA